MTTPRREINQFTRLPGYYRRHQRDASEPTVGERVRIGVVAGAVAVAAFAKDAVSFGHDLVETFREEIDED